MPEDVCRADGKIDQVPAAVLMPQQRDSEQAVHIFCIAGESGPREVDDAAARPLGTELDEGPAVAGSHPVDHEFDRRADPGLQHRTYRIEQFGTLEGAARRFMNALGANAVPCCKQKERT